VSPALVRLAWESVAALAIAPLQDLLNLGNEARMNVPGRAEGNWRWRCTEDMLAGPTFDWLCDLTNTSRRLPTSTRPVRSETVSYPSPTRQGVSR
jgi:4-alpha-glucanotransferase